MPIIFSVLSSQFSVLSSQFSVLSSQFSVLSLGELFLANYIKYIQAKDRCVGMMHILCAHFRHDGLFAFKWNFSECSFFAWGAFRKIPNADFFIRELSEKFQRQTFCLGSVWKNSAGRLSSQGVFGIIPQGDFVQYLRKNSAVNVNCHCCA